MQHCNFLVVLAMPQHFFFISILIRSFPEKLHSPVFFFTKFCMQWTVMKIINTRIIHKLLDSPKHKITSTNYFTSRWIFTSSELTWERFVILSSSFEKKNQRYQKPIQGESSEKHFSEFCQKLQVDPVKMTINLSFQ